MSVWETMPTIEDEILLWAAGGDWEGAPAWLPARLVPAQSVRLVERAVAEGMAGLLCRRLLTGRRMELLAEKERERLRSIYYLTLQTNLRHLEVLKEILSSFQSAGVPAVVIQGMALLITLYQDPGERPVSDIDLWVPPGSFAPAVALLKQLGFRAAPLYPRLFRRGEVLIDLHTHLLGAERIGAWRHLLQIDQEAIFEECRRRVHEGVAMRLLAPADQVIYLTIHAVKHNLERLVWMADLRRLADEWGAAEWEELGRRAAEIGQPRIPALLEGLLSIVGTGLPAHKVGSCGSGFQPRSDRGKMPLPPKERLTILERLPAPVAGGRAVQIPPAPLFQRGVKEKILFQREKKGEALFQREKKGEMLFQREKKGEMLFQREKGGEILFQREKKGEILFQMGEEAGTVRPRGEEAGGGSHPNLFPPLAKGARGILSLLSSGERSRAGHGLSVLERHLLRRRRRGPLPKWSFLFLLHAGGRLKQLAFAIESMFPRPAVLRQVFSGREDLNNWELYVLRIRQLLGMLGY